MEWLTYLIEAYLAPWGYVLGGAVEWIGEEADDRGRIVVEANRVRVQRGRVVYEDAES